MIRDKLTPWRMAQLRKAVVPFIIAPLVWWSVFFDTWDEVRYGRDPSTKA